MLLHSILSVAALFVAAVAAQEDPAVFTATRVVNTVTDVAPFFMKTTTTLTWTASPSTVVVQPTGPGGF